MPTTPATSCAPGPGPAAARSHDGTGAITRRTEGTDTESFAYNGERLTSSTRGGATKRYAYDEFGSMTKEGANLESPETTYTYDTFERLTGGRGQGQAAESTYRYDGLDRRDYRTENGTRYDSSYVSSSEALSREQDPGKTQSYDYDSAGESQGQAASQSRATAYRSYGKDANGSVEGLEGTDGQIAPASRYDYDPYGKLENEQAVSDPAARDNPIRFEGFRYDSGLKTYDMQARQYRPDIGRFLTQDRFESASGDVNLQSDPLTQNRYAFAGGNPVSRVEWDGHRPGCKSTSFRYSDKGRVRNCPAGGGRLTGVQLKPGTTSELKDSNNRPVLTVSRSSDGVYSASVAGTDKSFTPSRVEINSFAFACEQGSQTLISFDGADIAGPNPRRQFRGFVGTQNLDFGGRTQNRKTVCGKRAGRFMGRHTIRYPNFAGNRTYERNDDKEGGNSYASYNERLGGSIYLSSATTAVRGGGVANAVVRAGQTFYRYGSSTRKDRNAQSGPGFKWSYEYVRGGPRGRIYDWTPTQALNGAR